MVPAPIVLNRKAQSCESFNPVNHGSDFLLSPNTPIKIHLFRAKKCEDRLRFPVARCASLVNAAG